MAFLVEDGSVVSDANSYGTLVEFGDYWTDRNVDLSSYSDTQKQAALIEASSYVDRNYEWKGNIVKDAQSMDWPRKNVTDDEGRKIGETTIPGKLKFAVFEYAKREIIKSGSVQPDVSHLGAVKKTTRKASVITTTNEYQDNTGGYYGKNRIPAADLLLSGFIVGSVYGGMSSSRRDK